MPEVLLSLSYNILEQQVCLGIVRCSPGENTKLKVNLVKMVTRTCCVSYDQLLDFGCIGDICSNGQERLSSQAE